MPKIGRNALCPCGSGLKYKRCCESKDLLAHLNADTIRAAMETALSELVYGSVLTGVWTLFHPESNEPPAIEVLEDFYHEIYGYDLDRDSLDEFVLPLPDEVFANLAPPTEKVAPVIDLAAWPETTPPVNSRAEPFPPSTPTPDCPPPSGPSPG